MQDPSLAVPTSLREKATEFPRDPSSPLVFSRREKTRSRLRSHSARQAWVKAALGALRAWFPTSIRGIEARERRPWPPLEWTTAGAETQACLASMPVRPSERASGSWKILRLVLMKIRELAEDPSQQSLIIMTHLNSARYRLPARPEFKEIRKFRGRPIHHFEV